MSRIDEPTSKIPPGSRTATLFDESGEEAQSLGVEQVGGEEQSALLSHELLHPAACPQCEEPLVYAFEDVHTEEELRFCSKCQLPLVLVAGKYRLEKKLAEGGNGVVYLARHVHLSLLPLRVVKFLKPELFMNPTATRRFLREVQLTATVSQINPHIVRVYDDFGEVPQLGLYYVMEHLSGRTLSEALRNESLTIDQKLDVFSQLCEAIDAAHQAGVVHRDIKPSNIFLTGEPGSDAFVKVMDFGVAKFLGGESVNITRGNEVPGTPVYMAPEQFLDQGVDNRTDVYCLGVLLYELLVGHPPFVTPGQSLPSVLSLAHCHIHETPKLPASLHSSSSKDRVLRELLRCAMAKKPEERFASVHDLLVYLSQVITPKTPLAADIRLQANAAMAMQSRLEVGDSFFSGVELANTRDTAPELAQIRSLRNAIHQFSEEGELSPQEASRSREESPTTSTHLPERAELLFQTPSKEGLVIASSQKPFSTLALGSGLGESYSEDERIASIISSPLSTQLASPGDLTYRDIEAIPDSGTHPSAPQRMSSHEGPQTELEIAVVGNTSLGLKKGRVLRSSQGNLEAKTETTDANDGSSTIPESQFLEMFQQFDLDGKPTALSKMTTIVFFSIGVGVLALIIWSIVMLLQP